MSITARIDAITALAPAYRHPVLPAPKSVKIELTARCNFRCAFCASADGLREKQDMSWDRYTRLVDEMREAGVEELGLFYLGESFLVPWLPEAVAYAKSIGYPYVFLTTNGSLANGDRVAACMEAGLDSLKFSLNYSGEEQFKEVARVKPSYFFSMLDNIREASTLRRVYGYKTGLYCSYIAYDGEQGRRMKELVEEIRPLVDEIYALPLYSQATLKADFGEASAGNRGRLDAMREPLPCWAVFTEGHITYDGKLSACCFDHDGRFNMGDLNKVSFMDAWNSVAFQGLRKAHLARDIKGTVCEGCVVG